ncbi:MAG: peptidoglycan DD-metalloendopeptidase family protein [Rhizobiaceae bacterium]
MFKTIRKARSQLLAIILASATVLAFPHLANAQSTKNKLNKKQVNQLELDQVDEKIFQMKQRRIALKQEILGLDKDIGAINRALIEAAKKAQELETSIQKAEINLTALTKTQALIRQSLNSKRALMGEVLAALQRMGLKPPPAILVRPDDALSSIRSAILLGAVIPEIRAETRTLLAEIRSLNETTQKIEQQKSILTNKLNELSEDETRLTLLLEEKSSLTSRSKKDVALEQKKAADLAKRALSLKQLIGSLETQIASAAQAAKAAKEADKRREQNAAKRLTEAQEQLRKGDFNKLALGDTTRIEPAIPFSAAKDSLYFPVSGIQLYSFGSKSKTNNNSSSSFVNKHRNIALATRPNARVRTPADAWVVYAGPFRSYGQVLILNAGEGYHIVLSGLSQINVSSGQFILAGEPVGRMGTTRAATSLPANIGSNSPILYVEFRKGGSSIDSAPWWSSDTTTRFAAKDG